MEEIILMAALTVIIFYYRNKKAEYIESKKEWLIFFLLFVTIITAYSTDLVNRFSFIRLSILALSFILGVINYYKRFKIIQLK
jgi:hypothetical protein